MGERGWGTIGLRFNFQEPELRVFSVTSKIVGSDCEGYDLTTFLLGTRLLVKRNELLRELVNFGWLFRLERSERTQRRPARFEKGRGGKFSGRALERSTLGSDNGRRRGRLPCVGHSQAARRR